MEIGFPIEEENTFELCHAKTGLNHEQIVIHCIEKESNDWCEMSL